MIKEVVIATKNEGKINEFKKIFAVANIEIKSLLDIDENIEIIEDGLTFEENAIKKAQTIASLLKLPVLADDSGLVVPALNGEPGVYSARYAGIPKSDFRNNEKLLSKINEKKLVMPDAYFYCALALCSPKASPIIVTGRCDGKIISEYRGENGFGYDPIFYLPKFDKTMAEVDSMIKNSISHRGNAIKKLFNIVFKENKND